MTMDWYIFLAVSFFVVNAINRPVYKINLTQKGYAQFIEYDVDTPPLREFTICAWIRVYELVGDQRILTYVTKGNNRALRLWLDSGGTNIKVSIKGKIPTSVPVKLVKDVWRHLCLSYQSDYGAWALYIDSRLAHCEAAQSLYGYVLPKGGSFIIGYGAADSGVSNGFEGEIFGVNMILISTIERNVTFRQDKLFEQKSFKKNTVKVVDDNKMKYVVFSDLQPEEIHNTFEKATITTEKSFIKQRTPFSYIDHSVGVSSVPPKFEQPQITLQPIHQNYHDSTEIDKTKSPNHENNDLNLSALAEFETPPSPKSTDFFEKNLLTNKEEHQHIMTSPVTTETPEFDIGLPTKSDNKVYGQWTGSNYAGSVLKYLKSINFQKTESKMKRVPKTLPLTKFSDSHPYASDFKSQRLRPPAQFSRRNLVERHDIHKRIPQINVKILEDDFRSAVIRTLAQTRPKLVEITNRGESKGYPEHRFYRSVNYEAEEGAKRLQGIDKHETSTLPNEKNMNPWSLDKITTSGQKHVSVLPFIKSLENNKETTEAVDTDDASTNNDMYTKTLNANKWHNVKSYSNDFTPRRIPVSLEDIEDTKMYPPIRLKYKHDQNIVVEDDNPHIIKGRILVTENQHPAPDQINSAYLLKYNHGYLPSHDIKNIRSVTEKPHKVLALNNFDRHVKIGNALNEKHILRGDVNHTKNSFVGGIANIPDINKLDEDNRVRPLPGQRVCMNVELYDRFLYIQSDESIDMTHILSPIRKKNWAIDFIMQNYKKCSLSESIIEKNSMLLIDWSNTPVRLFGGAYPRTTTDLCGFF